MKKILLCAPTYNESENIEIFCKKIFNINKNFHLLIIDDTSPDGTYKIIEKLRITTQECNKPNSYLQNYGL